MQVLNQRRLCVASTDRSALRSACQPIVCNAHPFTGVASAGGAAGDGGSQRPGLATVLSPTKTPVHGPTQSRRFLWWTLQVSPAGGAAGEGDFQRLGLAMAPPLGRAAEFLSDSLDDVQVGFDTVLIPQQHGAPGLAGISCVCAWCNARCCTSACGLLAGTLACVWHLAHAAALAERRADVNIVFGVFAKAEAAKVSFYHRAAARQQQQQAAWLQKRRQVPLHTPGIYWWHLLVDGRPPCWPKSS